MTLTLNFLLTWVLIARFPTMNFSTFRGSFLNTLYQLQQIRNVFVEIPLLWEGFAEFQLISLPIMKGLGLGPRFLALSGFQHNWRFFLEICVLRYFSVGFVAIRCVRALKIFRSVFLELWFRHSPPTSAVMLDLVSLSRYQ